MEYTTFETLTVKQYQDLYYIHKGTDDDIDKIIQSVCVLTGLSERGVEDLPLPVFNKISAELSRIFSKDIQGQAQSFINIGGAKYGINYLPATLTAGQYVEVQTWMQTNVIENLHKIFASIVYQVKGKGIFKKRLKYNPDNHNQVSEAILSCRFADVYFSCVFFLELWKSSINSLADYLEKEGKKKGVNPIQMRDILKNISDGYIMQSGFQNLKA